MSPMTVRFDDSLPVLAEVIRAELGASALQAGTALRDVTGCLAFFAATPLAGETVERLSSKLRAALGPYSRTDRVIAGPDDYGSAIVRDDPSAFTVCVGKDSIPIRVVDRRLVGADWLHAPSPPAPPPPRVVFASHKGGVGRSTAITVVAAHLASRGKRVLAVDLDMEAPGLGAMLLTLETLPRYGLIDALVENGLSRLDEGFYADLVGPSELAGRAGRVDVVPAIGQRSLENPADVLAKIARAYAEDVQPDGTTRTLLDQIRAIVDHLADPARYDIVLVDARAGLHETTASAVLGLGAEILLFGLDEPQTFQGYALLLAHLSRFASPGAPVPEWAERLTMVQGKAPMDVDERAGFSLRCRDLFAKAGLGVPPSQPPSEVPLPAGPFKDVPWDDDLPDEAVLPAEWAHREPLAILYNGQYHRFDPHQRRDLLTEGVYRTTFGELLDRMDAILGSAEKNS